MEFRLIKAIFSLLFAGGMMLSAASGLDLGGSGEVEMRGFRTDGISALRASEADTGNSEAEKENVTWEIRGEKAMVSKEECRISGFEMKVDSPKHGEYFITSPKCEFNTASRTVRSNAAFNLRGQKMEVSGNGYDLYWSEEENRFTIVIRDAVRITLDRLVMTEKTKIDGKPLR